MWTLMRVTPPANPVLSLEEAKLHLRVEHDAEDSLISRIVDAATERCESFQLRSFVTQTWQLTLPRFPYGRRILLPRPPLQSVTSVVYTDSDDAEQTVAVADYRADVSAGSIILGVGDWPSTATDPDAVRITYVAGYGNEGTDVPEAARAAILLLVGHLYENREAVTIGTGPTFKIPLSVEWLLYPNRHFERDPLGGY